MYKLLNESFIKNNTSSDIKAYILLIDDLPENLQILHSLLALNGYQSQGVTSGEKAIAIAKSQRPDIILLDVKMPEMDGYQVCQAFKSDPDFCDIPIIFISALDDTFDKLKAFEVGGVDYITKPFQVKEVVARLEAQLTIQRHKQMLKDEISRRKEIEEVLYQSRALIASVLNGALDGIAAMQSVRDPLTSEIRDFRCLVVNPVISKILGRNREDIIGKLFFRKFICQQNMSGLFERFVSVVDSGLPLNDDFYYPLGDSCWYHYVAVKLGDGFAITIRDITVRKQMELALQEANQKLELLANSDGLTHIANRRSFDHYLSSEWQRHQRDQNPIALIMIDIDYFKYYNDHYGHHLGDECLVVVAQVIAKVPQRPTDLVARYGGEEFAVILSNTEATGAIKVAEAIQEAIFDLAIPHPDSKVSDRITLSMGIACMIPSLDNDLETLTMYADQFLYVAKRQGRNQVFFQEII